MRRWRQHLRYLAEHGSAVVNRNIVVSDRVITSAGPRAAQWLGRCREGEASYALDRLIRGNRHLGYTTKKESTGDAVHRRLNVLIRNTR